jgi:mannobiose 2-epimerase
MKKVINANYLLALFLLISSTVTVAADLNNRLNNIKERVNKLDSLEASFWMKYGFDSVSGSFYGIVKDDGTPDKTAGKGLIQQSRHLWAFSTYYGLKNKSEKVKNLCDKLFSFIVTSYTDAATKGMFFKVNSTGKEPVKTKMCYAEGFAVYAFSEYSRVFNSQEARQRALDIFKAIDNRAHDPVNGGYDQTKDDDNWSKPAPKETNTLIHLMEAYTTLFEISQDRQVLARLEELFNVILSKVIQPAGYAEQTFTLDWKPYSTDKSVSYGHDIETAWLLMEAAEALGKSKDTSVTNKIIKLGATAIREGFDSSNGGMFESGIAGDKVVSSNKIWWAHNEALAGLWLLFSLTNDTTYITKLEKTLDWIENKQMSKVNKSVCYWQVDGSGNAIGTQGTNAGSEWKASYHSMRSYMFVEKWINDYLSTNVSKSPSKNSRKILNISINNNQLKITSPVSQTALNKTIKIDIFNLKGQNCYTSILTRAEKSIICNLDQIRLAPGLYTVELHSDNLQHKGSFVKN